MDSLPVGSVQSWLAVATATVSPVIALMVGFAGTDWLIRRQLGEMCDHAPLEGGELGGSGVHSRRLARRLGTWSRRGEGPCNHRAARLQQRRG